MFFKYMSLQHTPHAPTLVKYSYQIKTIHRRPAAFISHFVSCKQQKEIAFLFNLRVVIWHRQGDQPSHTVSNEHLRDALSYSTLGTLFNIGASVQEM